MRRLFIPTAGLVATLGAVFGSVTGLSSESSLELSRSLTILLVAISILFAMAAGLAVWSQPHYSRLKRLRGEYPDWVFHNVLIDSRSFALLKGGKQGEMSPRGETRFTLCVAETSIQLWSGAAHSPIRILDRDKSSIAVQSVEALPSAGRESPTVVVTIEGGRSIYFQPMGPLGGVIRSSNLAARELSRDLASFASSRPS